jgi:hypothetical protein
MPSSFSQFAVNFERGSIRLLWCKVVIWSGGGDYSPASLYENDGLVKGKLRLQILSPSAAPHAARQERQSDMEMATMATGPSGKCFPQYVPSVAKRPKYHSSPIKVNQYLTFPSPLLTTKEIYASECSDSFQHRIGWFIFHQPRLGLKV